MPQIHPDQDLIDKALSAAQAESMDQPIKYDFDEISASLRDKLIESVEASH